LFLAYVFRYGFWTVLAFTLPAVRKAAAAVVVVVVVVVIVVVVVMGAPVCVGFLFW
jgi:hypothetical protein